MYIAIPTAPIDGVSFTAMFSLADAVSDLVRVQYQDNCHWIREASKHQLVSHTGLLNIV